MEYAAERNSEYNTTATIIKLLIISADCDPKAELPLPRDSPVVTWNDVVDALSTAKYLFAMLALPTPPPNNDTNLTKIEKFPTNVAFLSLQASKKAAFFSGDDFVNAICEITYDDLNLMNDLPSFHNLKGNLPRFHLFTSLPEDLQLNITERLDGIGFSRMRCVSRKYSRLRWSRGFNILKYSHPYVNKHRAAAAAAVPVAEEMNNNNNNGGGVSSSRGYALIGVSAVCLALVMYDLIVRAVRPVYADEYVDDE